MSVIKKLSYSCIQLEVKQKVRIVRFQTKKLNVYTCTHRDLHFMAYKRETSIATTVHVAR